MKRKKDDENARDFAKIVGLSGTLPTGIKMIKMKGTEDREINIHRKKTGTEEKGCENNTAKK